MLSNVTVIVKIAYVFTLAIEHVVLALLYHSFFLLTGYFQVIVFQLVVVLEQVQDHILQDTYTV